MSWKQFLTEKVLGGCWHELTGDQPGCTCKKCGAGFSAIHYYDWNPKGFVRTFNNHSDLMDLYAKVYKDGKWKSFEEYQFNYWDDLFPFQKEDKVGFIPWLFCLGGKCYDLGCKAVAEFYGWKGYDND